MKVDYSAKVNYYYLVLSNSDLDEKWNLYNYLTDSKDLREVIRNETQKTFRKNKRLSS